MPISDQTRVLLLKARKKADAGFGAANWATVLRALGFQYEVTKKERAQVLAVRITAPNGAVLDVEKNPRSKTIGFGLVHLPMQGHEECDRTDSEYGTPIRCICGARGWPCYRLPHTSLSRWAEEQGYPIHDLAARALDMMTVEEERKFKEYKARDWTHTGTCGVCGQNIKMENMGERTALVLHGYCRPGDGATRGECFGRGYPPHELSPDAARAWLDQVLVPQLGRECWILEQLGTGKITRIRTREADERRGREAEYVCKGDPTWPRVLSAQIESQERAVEYATHGVREFALKVAGWQLDELPEFKMAKLFGEKSS